MVADVVCCGLGRAAFEKLVDSHMLSAGEQRTLLASLRFRESDVWLKGMYRARLHKYDLSMAHPLSPLSLAGSPPLAAPAAPCCCACCGACCGACCCACCCACSACCCVSWCVPLGALRARALKGLILCKRMRVRAFECAALSQSACTSG